MHKSDGCGSRSGHRSVSETRSLPEAHLASTGAASLFVPFVWFVVALNRYG